MWQSHTQRCCWCTTAATMPTSAWRPSTRACILLPWRPMWPPQRSKCCSCTVTGPWPPGSTSPRWGEGRGDVWYADGSPTAQGYPAAHGRMAKGCICMPATLQPAMARPRERGGPDHVATGQHKGCLGDGWGGTKVYHQPSANTTHGPGISTPLLRLPAGEVFAPWHITC